MTNRYSFRYRYADIFLKTLKISDINQFPKTEGCNGSISAVIKIGNKTFDFYGHEVDGKLDRRDNNSALHKYCRKLLDYLNDIDEGGGYTKKTFIDCIYNEIDDHMANGILGVSTKRTG